mmetsp:Transcript_20308/g.51931  ORF Transcript_20308/g.51931 Transcript_20308/m.51931 type:complete len:209 (+) Transcript_20308:305-931(+)
MTPAPPLMRAAGVRDLSTAVPAEPRGQAVTGPCGRMPTLTAAAGRKPPIAPGACIPPGGTMVALAGATMIGLACQPMACMAGCCRPGRATAPHACWRPGCCCCCCCGGHIGLACCGQTGCCCQPPGCCHSPGLCCQPPCSVDLSWTCLGGGASSGDGGSPCFCWYFPRSRTTKSTFAPSLPPPCEPGPFLKGLIIPASTFSWMAASLM